MTYLEWLKIRIEYFDSVKHNLLLDTLHSIEFIPIIPMDENRVKDAIAIRDDYYGTCGNHDVIDSPCSFLEFLYALARRMNFIYARVDEDRTQDCFWTMIQNMGLNEIDDDHEQDGDIDYIRSCVDVMMYRKYNPDGSGGGLFPLKEPRTNQKNVEVWYQMNQYLVEVMREEGRL